MVRLQMNGMDQMEFVKEVSFCLNSRGLSSMIIIEYEKVNIIKIILT